MSKTLEVAEGHYAYTHDLPVEYEESKDVRRRQKRNVSRKHRAVESARQAGVPLYAVPRDLDGDEFDPAVPTSTMIAVADGDYTYAYDLPVEYEMPEDAKRRRKRNSSRKHRAVESARQAGVPLYAVPRDFDGDEFDPAKPMSKMLTVADGDPSKRAPSEEAPGGETALVAPDGFASPPADFWDRVADRLAARLVSLVRHASLF